MALAWQMRLGFGVWSVTRPISSDVFSIFQVHKCRIKYLSSANKEQTMVAYAPFGLETWGLIPSTKKKQEAFTSSLPNLPLSFF